MYQNCVGSIRGTLQDDMRRAHMVKPAGDWDSAGAIDQVLLDAHERHRRRVVLTGERGTTFLLDLPRATALRDGDGLVLDDGGIVRIVGRPEPLIEIAAASGDDLARLAWHIGNRHVEVQIVGDRLRIRRDHVIEEMLRGLGARLMPVEAPFDPEQGAYGEHAQDHAHDHARNYVQDPAHEHDHRHEHGRKPHDHDHERDHEHG
jgi:urease accessory protein